MSKEYDAYISEHKHNVQSAYDWLYENLPGVIRGHSIDEDISVHDISKYRDIEYEAYDDYFYGEKTKDVKEAFNYAWLHHNHNNPHHWQYWILINDDPENGIEALPMSYNFIVEMICD